MDVLGTFALCVLVALIAMFLIVVLTIWTLVRRSRADAMQGCCQRCGYLLRGLPSDICPECGTPFFGE